MVDLHTHSTASDGRFTPSEVAVLAARRGLRAWALTDHDTVDGLAEAAEASRTEGILFVPGIEIEVEIEAGEFHLLGLGLRDWSPAWAETLAEVQKRRQDRNHRIFERMQEAGIRGDFTEVVALAGGGQVGRPHFARFLVERGKVETIQEAFDHFLGRGQLFYEKKAALPVDDAIDLVHRAQGLAIVAHPLSLQLGWKELEARLVDWKARGLDGLEAWHPGAEPRHCRRLEALARNLGLRVTAGSDFHGDVRPGRALGLTAGGAVIEDRFLDEVVA